MTRLRTACATSSGSVRLVAAVCAAVIVVGSAPLSASAAQISAGAGAGKMASTTSFRDVQRAAISAAASAAAATGQGVAVDGMTSPTEQTLAMPDGTMVYEASTVPVRVELNGEWVGVDTTLTRVGDWFEPAASAAPVRFSPGGTILNDALAYRRGLGSGVIGLMIDVPWHQAEASAAFTLYENFQTNGEWDAKVGVRKTYGLDGNDYPAPSDGTSVRVDVYGNVI